MSAAKWLASHVLVVALASSLASAEVRKFRMEHGEQLVAELVDATPSKITLLRSGGFETSETLPRFSPTDREFIRRGCASTVRSSIGRTSTGTLTTA